MPHLVILYTPNIESQTDMNALCRAMADTMLLQRDDADKQVFPTGGARVLAFPAAHYAVADGSGDYAFVYLNVRMAAGRPEAVKKRIGDALLACAKKHFDPLIAQRHVGITLQIDESPGQVYDGKLGNLHPLFNK
ncbi:5-carboxymethyl-2-hydroxymuconate Delta-isomerase [Variovorax sp. J22R133]|uniref:5-carboxymethyl-2-hydroxymuconate Delta-isomerase n=1 Tax=Variovorax brevis TaxID=3053503 RepID=UPI002575CAF7|nr:5-carboxymethyl-2-hydroxymuconate Delta-isomerase [Variovorax sp. J22R133]MDM0111512.1 5-carboxymethyl-2-hydroxymuconate Delta-isomerase [Variovorax sp. J22R133]